MSATNGLWVGSSGATSIFGSATSTFGAGISATYLNLSGTSASSTAANGINLSAGCFAVNGTCVGGGGGTVTAVTGTWPIISSGGSSPAISFEGLSTSTAAVIGNIPYFSGVNTFANVATSSLTGTYPLQISGAGALVGSATTFSLAFGTTTSNTWGGTQTFTSNPILGSLTGLIAGNSGTLYQVASSSIFGFTPISNALTKGYFLVGDDAGVAQATSTFSISSTGTVTATHIAKSTYKSDGIHSSLSTTYISGTGTAGVDNTAQTVVTVVVPANTLTQVGDRMRIRTYWIGDTGTNITGTNSLNGVTIASTQDSGAATFQITEAWLHYIDATHANIIAMAGGGLDTNISAANVAGFNWASSQNATLSQNAISNNHIVVYALIVDVFPKGF